MKLIILAHLLFSQPLVAAEDLSKCNIDVAGDPNNKPECYMAVPKALSANMKLGGWPKGTELKKSASESSPTLATLVESGHWTDEEIELTGKTQGEWAEVKLRKFKGKLESCDEARKEKWIKRGWIKALDKSGKPIIWKWLYSGLC